MQEGLLKLSFHQTNAEIMVRAAATLIFNALIRAGCPLVLLSSLAEDPQYGFTASATAASVGPKFVRITDLQDANIDWETVPYCRCDHPAKYLLQPNDLLFARTGATTGKTHLVVGCPHAVFASYLIRLRPKSAALAEYLYSFFQSDKYWSQISVSKEGSAQPNVNGRKLMNLEVPAVDAHIESAIGGFLKAVRERHEGLNVPLPDLPSPLTEQRRIVSRIENLAAKVREAKQLRMQNAALGDLLYRSALAAAMRPHDDSWEQRTVADVILSMDAGWSPQCEHRSAKDGEWGVLKTTSVQWCDFRQEENKALPLGFEPRPELVVREGDVLVTRAGPRKRVGVVAAVRRSYPRLTISDKLIRLRPQKSKIDPRFLELSLAAPFSQEYLTQRKTGLADAQVNISQQILRATPLAYPPVGEQRRIVAYLDDLQGKVEAVKKLQSETSAELDALLPSILSKAFSGEL